jgi:hypothetical protein
MNKMDVGKLRPRQVIDEEDDQVQVLSNSNVQVDTNQASTSGSHDNMQDQVASKSSQPNDQASTSDSHDNMQDQVASKSSQHSNQPILRIL